MQESMGSYPKEIEQSSVAAAAKERYALRPTVLGEILVEKLPNGKMKSHKLKMPDILTVRENTSEIQALGRIGEMCAAILMTTREVPPTVTECKKAGVGKSMLKKMEGAGLLHVKRIAVNSKAKKEPKRPMVMKCVLLTPQGRKMMEKHEIWEQNSLEMFAKARSWLS